MKAIIKKHSKTKNQYILTEDGYWVRDFRKSVKPLDINDFTKSSDYQTFLQNESKNMTLKTMQIEDESVSMEKCIIVSDGHGFKKNIKLLKSLPKSVKIIAVNRVLPKWSIPRKIDFYVVNNPYPECMTYYAKKFFPPCIASLKTNHEFLRRYARQSTVYVYQSTFNEKFAGSRISRFGFVDDYRNPICAAINLAYKFGTTKLAFFCCDDVFPEERPAAEELKNGMWQYPQNNVAHQLIDGMLHWFVQREFEEPRVANFSMGKEYDNASYIDSSEGLLKFFTE